MGILEAFIAKKKHEVLTVTAEDTTALTSWIDNPTIHTRVSWVIIGLSPVVFLILHFIRPSTYGKLHKSKSNYFGPLVNARLCWFLFESPNWISVLLLGFRKHYSKAGCSAFSGINTSNRILLALFFAHYLHRSVVYPYRMSPTSQFPMGMLLFTIPYTITNGYLQSQALFRFSRYPENYITCSQCVVGLVIMFTGFWIGSTSDATLVRLKRQRKGYQIPQGGMFELVSCPHYFGEIVEWVGYAIARADLAAFCFALWTAANLVPRAIQQHEWYHAEFGRRYPAHRRAVFPFIL